MLKSHELVQVVALVWQFYAIFVQNSRIQVPELCTILIVKIQTSPFLSGNMIRPLLENRRSLIQFIRFVSNTSNVTK